MMVKNNRQRPENFSRKRWIVLGVYFDRGLKWGRKHVFAKRKQVEIQLGKMYWLLGSKSQLSTENKLLLYKAILKIPRAYGVPL